MVANSLFFSNSLLELFFFMKTDTFNAERIPQFWAILRELEGITLKEGNQDTVNSLKPYSKLKIYRAFAKHKFDHSNFEKN